MFIILDNKQKPNKWNLLFFALSYKKDNGMLMQSGHSPSRAPYLLEGVQQGDRASVGPRHNALRVLETQANDSGMDRSLL